MSETPISDRLRGEAQKLDCECESDESAIETLRVMRAALVEEGATVQEQYARKLEETDKLIGFYRRRVADGKASASNLRGIADEQDTSSTKSCL